MNVVNLLMLYVDYYDDGRYYREFDYVRNTGFDYAYYHKYDKKKMESQDYEEVVSVIEKVIETKLPKIIKRNYGIEIEAKLLGHEKGSVIATISIALLGTYNFIAVYSDFVESLKVIQEQTRRLIHNELPVGKYMIFSKTDYVMISRDHDWNEPRSIFKKVKISENNNEDLNVIVRNKRDGFFYFLLVSTILLFIAIALLVYKAVQTMYFK